MTPIRAATVTLFVAANVIQTFGDEKRLIGGERLFKGRTHQEFLFLSRNILVMDDKIVDLLQKADLRITKSRRDVLDILLQSGDQAISSQVIENTLTNIDRITLYRILKTFEESGLIHSVADGSGKTKYALCSHECAGGEHHDNHLHFYCRVCETTTCLDKVRLPAIKLPSEYVMEEMRFVVTGICKECH